MGVKKNTSERLEEVLSRYNLEALPDETKKTLEETMSRSDFDPDKLAEAIEREEQKRQATKADDDEHCPWYVSLTRILLVLGYVVILFIFVLAMLILFGTFCDKLLGTNFAEWVPAVQQNYPVAFYSILTVVFLVIFVYFITSFVKKVSEITVDEE